MQPEGQRLRFPFFLSSFSLLRLPHLPSFLLLHLWTFAKKSGVATQQLGEDILGEGPCWAVLRKASSRCHIKTLWLVRRPPAQISLAHIVYIFRAENQSQVIAESMKHSLSWVAIKGLNSAMHRNLNFFVMRPSFGPLSEDSGLKLGV